MYLKILTQLIAAAVLVACSDQHSTGAKVVDSSAPSSLPAATEPEFSAAQVERGRALHVKIFDKYPKFNQRTRKAFLWGSVIGPSLAVIPVPSKDWQKLSKEDRDSLGAYAASLVDVVRAFPFEFANIPESAPIAPTIRKNAAAMTSSSWGIMIGAISPDGRDLMVDDVAVRGHFAVRDH